MIESTKTTSQTQTQTQVETKAAAEPKSADAAKKPKRKRVTVSEIREAERARAAAYYEKIIVRERSEHERDKELTVKEAVEMIKQDVLCRVAEGFGITRYDSSLSSLPHYIKAKLGEAHCEGFAEALKIMKMPEALLKMVARAILKS